MTNSNECTCPSGNGSLRHPCPAHSKDNEVRIGAKAEIKRKDGVWLPAIVERFNHDRSCVIFNGKNLAKNTNGNYELSICVRTVRTQGKTWRLI